MRLNTRLFGEIEVDENRIIHFPNGIIGFPDCRQFILIHDEEDKEEGTISWLQSIEEPVFAMAVIDPLIIRPDYNPMVEDELLKVIGDIKAENMFVLVTVTIPKEIEKMSVNLKAPIIINIDEFKASQWIVEDTYPVKYEIYHILQAGKAGE